MSKKTKETEGDEPGLGALETDVMKVIWESDWIAVRDVYERLRLERSIAYTTVMTVMSRLFEKGMLERRQDGRTYMYLAKQTRLQVAGGYMRRLLERLFDGRKADAMAALLESSDKLDDSDLSEIKKQLAELERREKPAEKSVEKPTKKEPR